MKLGPETKIDKRNKKIKKKIENNVMPEDCDVISIISIYRQFRAIQKPDCRCMVCETYIFINSNVIFNKK